MAEDPTTSLLRAYCSARDQPIPVLVREAPDDAAHEDPELVSCLDYGVRCTGWLCPLFSVPTLPPEDLLEEAIEAERNRKDRTVSEGRAILERALRAGRTERDQAARRDAARQTRKQPRDMTSDSESAP